MTVVKREDVRGCWNADSRCHERKSAQGIRIERCLTNRQGGIIMANNKIRIRLKSFDHKILDASAEKIVAAAKKSGAQVVGPVPLPTEKEIYTT